MGTQKKITLKQSLNQHQKLLTLTCLVSEHTWFFFPYIYFDILEITEIMVPCTFKKFIIVFLNFSFILKGWSNYFPYSRADNKEENYSPPTFSPVNHPLCTYIHAILEFSIVQVWNNHFFIYVFKQRWSRAESKKPIGKDGKSKLTKNKSKCVPNYPANAPRCFVLFF